MHSQQYHDSRSTTMFGQHARRRAIDWSHPPHAARERCAAHTCTHVRTRCTHAPRTIRTAPHNDTDTAEVPLAHDNTAARTSTTARPCTHPRALRRPCTHAQHACARRQHAAATRTPPHMTLTPRTVMSPHRDTATPTQQPPSPSTHAHAPTVPARTHNTNVHIDSMLALHAQRHTTTLTPQR
jgi:hypothetical protein